ncbi:MAG: exodeoxyribonuclease V subunit beta [Bermanella sp.]
MNKNTSNTMQVLDVTRIALNGVSLIEASAGTGKTYTITSLYLRLVLGHKCDALSPENILVVTFTRAATEELRSRIRSRLRNAYLTLQQKANDPLIDEIKSEIDDVPAALQKLKDAQQLMDLAAIYTIHGFAQRLLRQNAVESGINGEFELLLDETELLEQAVRDVWRAKVYPLSGDILQLVLSQWKTPEQLLKDLRSLIYKHAHFHLGEKGIAGDFDEASQNLQTMQQSFNQTWFADSESFIAQILNHPLLHGTYSKGVNKRVATIQAYLERPHSIKTKDIIDALTAFTPQGLTKSVKKGGEPASHFLSVLCQSLIDCVDRFERAKTQKARQLRIEYLYAFRSRLDELKQQQQVLSTDDLLSHVNGALNGHNRDALLQQIRQQYPVAMVDEFQDTDAEQYQVFQSIYAQESIRQQHALFMIGDPKQAIYKFRGADIFTYIQAKQQVDYQYTLDTNYRSTQNMVSAVNEIFTQHAHPFIYDDSIPFLKVQANDAADSLVINNEVQPALSWVLASDASIQNKSSLNHACAQSCAEQISILLSGGQAQTIKVGENPLLASDVAVLVRNRQQAALVKNSLGLRGISCVYVGQESVFDSEEAEALLALLQGVHSISERQYRNAIAHPTWGLSLDDFKHFNQDEHAWEVQLEQLYLCHEIWQKQGVMAMVMHWLHSRQLPNTWLTLADGERRLTNMMHLAELLQHSSTQVQGMQGLLTWFVQQIMQSKDGAEQKQLRLESDANLVQIITIHKSKGLEYPVVFLPFNWDGKESSDELFYDEQAKQLVCDLADDFKEQRIQEGLAEEVRLLYVGLTRAASKCYVSIPEVTGNKRLDSNVHLSALQHVLFESAQDSRLPKLQQLVNNNKHAFEIAPLLSTQTVFKQIDNVSELSARIFNGRVKRDWQLSSFSSLVRNLHAPVSPRFDLDDDAKAEVITQDQQALLGGQFSFPRGAHAGNFLHTLLEEIDFTALPEKLDELIQSLLARFGIDLFYADAVKPWLHVILNSPLAHHDPSFTNQPLSLAALTPSMKKVEMEFYFPVETLNARDFNQLLNAYPCLNFKAHDLDFLQLKGMLKGFIDLTFEWGGQFFILDYKSNHLGNELNDYGLAAMEQAMAEHRYDVQMVIYTLALHRLLALRLPDYDYDRHIGGGYYLFLRGLDETNGETGQFYNKPDKQLILSLDRLIKGESLADILSQSSQPEQGSLL